MVWLMIASGLGGAFAGEASINSVKMNSGRVDRFGLFELTVDISASYTNPFDAGDISVEAAFRTPSGALEMVRGFYCQEYKLKVVGERPSTGSEVLDASGPPSWKIRYSPRETGEHAYIVLVTDRHGTVKSRQGQFKCIEGKSPGTVRVSSVDPRYFEFSDGSSYFPIGHNVCWADGMRPVSDFKRYFRRMQQAGENYTRLWMCSWSLGLEHNKLGEYDLANAWRLDRVLESAAKHGIYVKLCFDNFTDFNNRKVNPYLQVNGGMCSGALDFFTQPEARRHYRNRLRYILARWGWSDHIMAWELWNEVNYVLDDETDDETAVVGWTREMVEFIKQNDIYGHPVTSSLGNGLDWPEFWNDTGVDFVQVHHYIHGEPLAGDEQSDAASFAMKAADAVPGGGRPYLLAEFGCQDSDDFKYSELDTQGLHIHNALWASALSGAAGSPMAWWWDTYIEQKDLYFHFAALSAFCEGVRWTQAGWTPAAVEADEPVRVTGLQNECEALLWIQNRNNTWYRRIVQKQPVALLPEATITVDGLEDGHYRIEWWDIYGGAQITSVEREAAGGRLRLEPPVRSPDVACKIMKLGRRARGIP